MSKARANILSRLTSTRPDLPQEQPVRAEQKIPAWDTDQRIEKFSGRLRAVRAEVIVADYENWPEKLATLARQREFGNLLYGPRGPLGGQIEKAWGNSPFLPRLVSHQQEIEAWKQELFYKIDAAITSTRAGIAETGSLVLWPTVDEPRSYSLVPPVHIAVLDSKDLYATFTELVKFEDWSRGLPSNVLLISGPSKTADIEQTLAYGVHGPTELIVFLLR